MIQQDIVLYAQGLMKSGLSHAVNSRQKSEWIKQKKSVVGEGSYEFNDIEVIESLLTGVSEDWFYDIIFAPVITQDKNGGATVTVTVRLLVQFKNYSTHTSRVGIATEYVSSAKQLQLATPKAASMAMKNAAKKFGELFGASLNRGIDDAELPSVQVEKTDKLSREESYKEVINNCKTKAEVEGCKYMLFTPALKALAAKKLKTLKS